MVLFSQRPEPQAPSFLAASGPRRGPPGLAEGFGRAATAPPRRDEQPDVKPPARTAELYVCSTPVVHTADVRAVHAGAAYVRSKGVARTGRAGLRASALGSAPRREDPARHARSGGSLASRCRDSGAGQTCCMQPWGIPALPSLHGPSLQPSTSYATALECFTAVVLLGGWSGRAVNAARPVFCEDPRLLWVHLL